MAGTATSGGLRPDTRSGRALVRRPGPMLAAGLVTHMDRTPVDVDLALEQWHGYVAAFERNGWPTLEAEPADTCPDAPFVEDTMVIVGDLAVVTRPGVPQRQPETEGVTRTMRDLGYQVRTIIAPGTLDGGDVLKLGRTWFVGVGGRTNTAGLTQLVAATADRGISVVAVPISGVLHLKTAVTALPDGTLLANIAALGRPDVLPPLTPAPDRGPWRMILLGPDRALLSASAPRTADLLVRRGVTPVIVDISEFEKLESSVTCLSVRLRE